MHRLLARSSALLAAAMIAVLARSAAATPGTVPYPGQTSVPPDGQVTFVQPQASSAASSVGRAYLTVVNSSDESALVAFDGSMLTISAPTGWSVYFVAGCNGAPGNPATCAKQPCSVECDVQPEAGVVGFTLLPTAPPPAVPSTGGPPPQLVDYRAGWNLIGVTQAGAGLPTPVPLERLTPDGTEYEAISPTDALPGVGYWAYFPRDERGESVYVSPCQRIMSDPSNPSVQRCVPAFPPITVPAGHWVMISNPYGQAVAVAGADVVYVYSTATGEYQQTSVLSPGEGAFAYSASGGQLTFVAPLAQP